MKLKLLPAISLMMATLFVPALQIQAQPLTAKDIVRKANDKVNGESSQGTMKMTILRPDWSREVSMKSWSKGTEYYMIYITSPARDLGQVFMKRQSDMWNWMPSINRMIKLPPSMMSQSWMGSDFTNDDLVRMNSIVEDYDHSILGSETIAGFECYKIQLIPHEDAAVVWGKILLWVSKTDFYELKAEYYDEESTLISTMTSTEIRQMGDRKLPAVMTMVPADKPGNKTIMEMVDVKFNVPIDDEFFSQQNMKNIR
jgi:outer membrane lipoprotein-sorting protein